MRTFKKLLKKKLWESLSAAFAALMTVMFVLNAAIVPFNNEIHGFLNTKDYIEVKVNAKNGEAEKIIDRPAYKNAENIEDYYRAVNEEVEGEGLVLLKNDVVKEVDNGDGTTTETHALPLASGEYVSFALSGSAKIFYATHGPGVRREGTLIDLYSALDEQTDLKLNKTSYDFLESGAGQTSRGIKAGVGRMDEPAWSVYKNAKIDESYKNHKASGAASEPGTVVAVITRESGEGADISWKGSDGADGSYLSLTISELNILEQLALMKRGGSISKIIVLINSAMTVQCDFLFNESYGVDAAMWIGLPGATGMNAVADALMGKINPSGRLSDTFLMDNFSNPAAMAWKQNGGFSSEYTNTAALGLNSSQKYYGVYVEGMYAGYRYYETRYEDYVMKTAGVGEYSYSDDVAYPFGYGKSYTQFEYSDFAVAEEKEQGTNKITGYNISVKVKNTGTVAGKEVVQIYMQKPYSDYSKMFGIEKPSVELVGFGKTKLLDPGQEQVLSATVADEIDMEKMRVDFEQLRSYDSQGAGTYILDKGKYYLTVAKDAHDAANNILAEKNYTVAGGMDAAGNKNLTECILDQANVDTAVFSKSSAKVRTIGSGLVDRTEKVDIVNQLDFMDPNEFAGVTNDAAANGQVVYVSRKNWLGTLPKDLIKLSITDKSNEKYDVTSHKTIVEQEGAAMPKFGDTSSDLTLAMMDGLEYNDPQWDTLLNKISQDDLFLTLTNCYGFTPAVTSIAKPMTDEDDGPYGISNTAEGFSSMSCEGIIAATFSNYIFDKVGEAIAADGRSGHDASQKNLHGLYAPGLNMHRVAFGGRASEYFSEDPYLSGIAAVYEIQSMQEWGVVAHPKHFIFNDEETNRNGIAIWMNEQTAREFYLLPWEYALRADMGNAHALMTSFNRAGLLWTSANDNLMENILRDEWAFDGYTLTDMAGSNGKLFMVYDDGFMNGTDLFLDKGTLSGFTKGMRNSTTFNLKLRESMHRLLYVVANYSAALDGYSNLTRLQPVVVWWKALITTFNVVFITGTVVSVIMFALSDVDKKKNIFKVKQK